MRRCSDMKYHFAAKLRIYPSSEQRHIIAVNDGARRFVYNRLTAIGRELFELKKIRAYLRPVADRISYLETVRSSRRELLNAAPFLNGGDIDSLAVDNAIKSYHSAWKMFREVPGTGIPRFHKKSYEQSYQTNAHYPKGARHWDDGNVHFLMRSPGEQVPHVISLPKLGDIRFRCSRKVLMMLVSHKEDTRVGTVTVRRDACGDYYASLQLSSDMPFAEALPRTGRSVGIDMNLTNLYTDSSGNMVPNPRYGRSSRDKLAAAQRKLSRMKEQAIRDGRSIRTSSNYQKQRLRTARIQRRVANCRDDYLHVQTKRLVERGDLIVSEDLKVKNLQKNHALAYSIADVSWGRFFVLLRQKARLYGKEYIQVPARGTTQTCSECGHVMSGDERIRLGVEMWTCPKCNAVHLRDHNAAKNILERGLSAI